MVTPSCADRFGGFCLQSTRSALGIFADDPAAGCTCSYRSFPTKVFCLHPCRSDKCPTRSSASRRSSSRWTSRDPSCSCSGASLLTTTWISAQKPQPESPSVARQTVTPAVPSSLLAFPSRYRQPPSSRGGRERASAFQPGDVGGSPGPWPRRNILPE